MTRGVCVRIGVALALAAAGTPAWADPELYQRVAPAAVALYDPQSPLPHGSGVLVDAERGLVVTAEHVVQHTTRLGSRNVLVVFPHVQDGKVVTDARFYRRNLAKLGIPGQVFHIDARRDVAVIRLSRLPQGVKPVPLATADPLPGDDVHVVGQSTAQFGALFGYNQGKVRNSFFWINEHLARYTLSHHAPTNKGDSGGPIVNGRGELVAIVSQGTTGGPSKPGQWTFLQQVVDHSTHVREIRAALRNATDPTFTGPVARELVVTGTLPRLQPQRFFDVFFVPVRKGEPVELELSGEGKADLDLLAFDDQGKKLVEKRGTADRESATITPTWTGRCEVRVESFDGNRDRYSLKARWAKAAQGQFSVIRRLEQRTADVHQLYYPAGKTVRAAVLGDSDTDIDVEVRDPAGNVVAAGNGPTDDERLTWNTTAEGVYTLTVTNKGNIWNHYVLTTD